MILDIALSSSLSAFCLFVWFKTNFLYEYVKLFKLNNIKIFKEYEDFIKVTYLDFADFLGMKNGFIYKLLSCPLCLGFWFNLIIIFIYNFPLLYIGILYVISIMEYMILSLMRKYEQN